MGTSHINVLMTVNYSARNLEKILVATIHSYKITGKSLLNDLTAT